MGDNSQPAVRRSNTSGSSFGMSSISMPGRLRNMKTKCFGPVKMPNDPLEAQRQEIASFESVLSVLTGVVQTSAVALDNLCAAPSPLYEHLQYFFPSDVPCSAAAVQMCNKFKSFDTNSKNAHAHLAQAGQMIQDLQEQNARIREAFKERDLAWQTRAHYGTKVDHLSDQARGGSSPKLSDKLTRNVAKKQESEQVFDRAMADTGRLAESVLAVKWQRTAEILSKLCRFYMSAFEASGSLSTGLRDVADQLVAPSTAEAMRRKSQELATQAKERMSNASKTFRDKFSWSGAGGGKSGGAPDECGAMQNGGASGSAAPALVMGMPLTGGGGGGCGGQAPGYQRSLSGGGGGGGGGWQASDGFGAGGNSARSPTGAGGAPDGWGSFPGWPGDGNVSPWSSSASGASPAGFGGAGSVGTPASGGSGTPWGSSSLTPRRQQQLLQGGAPPFGTTPPGAAPPSSAGGASNCSGSGGAPSPWGGYPQLEKRKSNPWSS